jgi:hypothetical protein
MGRRCSGVDALGFVASLKIDSACRRAARSQRTGVRARTPRLGRNDRRTRCLKCNPQQVEAADSQDGGLRSACHSFNWGLTAPAQDLIRLVNSF